MRLQTRLGLAAITVIGMTAGAISYSALVISTNSEVARLNSAINLVVDGANATPEDPVTPASELGDLSAVPLTVAVVVDGTDLTVLNESRVKFKVMPSLSILASATDRPISVRDTESYQLRTIKLADDQYVLVAASLEGVDRNASDNRVRFALITLVSVLLGSGFIVWLIRREIRTVDELIVAADDISRGDTDTIIVASGSTELARLGESLGRMVTSLNRAVELERETHQRMQRFLGDASHELRTPLTVVRGYTELLATPGDVSAEQRERALERIRTEIARMEQLIRDLLLLTELGSAPALETSSVDLSALVRDVVEDLRVLQPDRPLRAEVAGDLVVEGSEAMLRQLLANAVANLARHTPADAPAHVRAQREDGEVVVVVEDGGPGLGEDGYRRGIEEFTRFDPSRSRDSGGSGLGMSIMAAIARRHGGSIGLSKSELGGLRLELRLPA